MTALDRGLHVCSPNTWLRSPWVGDGYRKEEIRVPKITRVVEIFLNATGTRVSPNIIQQCWPARSSKYTSTKLGRCETEYCQ